MSTLAILKSLHTLDNSDFIRGLSESEKRSRRTSQRIGRGAKRMAGGLRNATNQVFNLHTAIGVLAGSAGIGLLVRNQMQAIDTTAKFSRMIGESTKEISGLQHAAEITAGVADKEFRMAFQRMTRRIAEAAKGTGEAQGAIEDLGLSAEELAKAGPAAAFKLISTAIQGVEDPAQRVRIAFKLFDSEGAALVNTLNAGTTEIERLQAEAEALGKTFTEIDAAQVEAANDAITRMNASFEGMQTRLAVDLAPLIAGVADEITAMADEADGFQKQFGQAGRFALGVVKSLADGIHTLRIIFKGVELVAVGFNAAVATAIEAVLQGLVNMMDSVHGMINEVISGFNRIPGVDVPLIPMLDDTQFMKNVRGIGHAARETVGMVRSDLHDMLMEPLPSETIDDFVKRAQEAASEARSRTGSRTPIPEGGEAGGSDAANEMAKQQKRLDAIREGLATEMQLERAHFEREQEFLTTAHETLFESEAERKLMLRNLEREHQSRLFEIQAQGQGSLLQQQVSFLKSLEAAQKSSGAAQVGIMSNAFAQITAAGAQHSKELFRINQIAGIANAIVSTHQAAARALAEGGPFAGPALAAMVTAIGFAKVAAIRSQSFSGSGGAAPSSSAGGGVPSVQNVGGQQQQQQNEPQPVVFEIRGHSRRKTYDADEVEEIFRTANDLKKDGSVSIREFVFT